jgi:hypothetical protein
MTSMPELLWSCDAQGACDYGQMYIYSTAGLAPDAWDEEDVPNSYPPDKADAWGLALEDAWENGNYLGVSKGVVDVLTAEQWNFEVPVHIEVWSAEPSSDIDDWYVEADVDMDIPDGRLVFQASGGGEEKPVDVPPGRYRARVSGTGYALTSAEASGRYRIRLWARREDAKPIYRKVRE